MVEYRDKFEIHFQAAFSSERKRMSTIVQVGEKHYVFMKGASEYMIDCCDKFLEVDTSKIIDLTQDIRKELNNSILNMAKNALRTIGLCFKEINIDSMNLEDKDDKGVFKFEEGGFVMVGICGIKDIIRKEVPNSIRKCKMAGIEVKMITGDNKITA